MNLSTATDRRVTLRGLQIFAALLVLVTALSSQSAGAAMDTDKSPSPRKLVIFGASYAHSWGTPPLPGYKVVNRGVGGEQTKDMRSRFQRDVVAAGPDVVLIWGHINSITQSNVMGSTPERSQAVRQSAREDYLAMVAQAHAAGIEVMLATEIPLAEPVGLANEARALIGRLRGKQSYASQVNAKVRDLNAFIRHLAASEGLRLLDFDLVFAPDGGARKPEYAAEDRSHVTAAGYQALTAYAVAEIGKRT
jgi:lysophospholipase L1-like esterase